MLSTCGTSLSTNRYIRRCFMTLATCNATDLKNKVFTSENLKHKQTLSSVKPLTTTQEQITCRPITTEYYINRMMKIQEKSQKKLNREGHGAFIYKKNIEFFKKAIRSPEQKIIGTFIKEGGEDVLVGYIVLDNTNIKSHIDPELLPDHIRTNIDKINYSGTMITDPDYASRIKGIGNILVSQANKHSMLVDDKNFTVSLVSAENFPSIKSFTKNGAYIARAFIDPEDNTETYLIIRDLQQKISSDKIKILKISKRIDKQKAMLLYNKIKKMNDQNPDIFYMIYFDEEQNREESSIGSYSGGVNKDSSILSVLSIPRNI